MNIIDHHEGDVRSLGSSLSKTHNLHLLGSDQALRCV